MRQVLFLVCLFFSLGIVAAGQGLSDSNLPIVIINTDGGANIPDNPKMPASMKIIYRGAGERNYMTDKDNPLYLNYDGRIGIELRGSSSQESPKKQYGFSTLQADNITNNNVSLLGFPSENDWILNGMTYDTARIRDFFAYNLSRQLGNYASRTAYCEVIINDDYKGLYLLQEKIKVDDNRVDVTKIGLSDINLPEVSGGYITKADKADGDPIAWTMYTHYGSPVDYIHVSPKPEYATVKQTEYIKNEFLRLETAASEGNRSVIDGYPSIIDMPSFIDFMMIAELTANVDAYTYSTYFHKDRNGKLRAGPVWDYDLTLGNDLFFWGYDRSKTTGWYFYDYQLDGSTFWLNLYNDGLFKCYLSRRWNELIQPGQPLNPSTLETFIDQTAAKISEGLGRDYTRWGIDQSHQQDIADIKTFLNSRIAWIADNIGPFSSCNQITVPPLVITKIMYHPATSVEFPDDDDLEFIEIKNNGNEVIDLTGFYFRGTGLVYQFPEGATIDPGYGLYLASDAFYFEAKYGFAPFDQYTRKLSNKGQSLVLADAFGNIIDNVTYYDESPWPDADGNGKHLQLIDPDYDNSLAESWIAASQVIDSDGKIEAPDQLMLFPNPTKDKVKLNSSSEILTISLFDIQGCLLKVIDINSRSYEFDMTPYIKGIYFLKIKLDNKILTKPIIKE